MWLLPHAAAQDSRQAVFTSFDAPNAVNTRARAINSEGDVVGWFRDTSSQIHGFLRTADGTSRVIDVPVTGATVTQPLGINDRGDIVGTYTGSDGARHGFLMSHTGEFSSFDPLNSTDTVARSVNDSGDIAGFFNFFLHGYLLSGDGSPTQIDVPFAGVTDTQVYSVNNRGEVAGSFDDAVGGHGFVRTKDGDYGTAIDFPGAQGATQLFGNNSRGDVVGCYGDSRGVHAWMRSSAGDFTSFDNPEAQQPGVLPKSTIAWGINSEGDIVGEYFSPADKHIHGFVRRKGD
jgi:probable HAF family extracellular repeat protein